MTQTFKKQRKAFTMIELIFVVTVIGILSAIAIPKFVQSRDDALITKASTTIAAVRNAIATKRQQNILKGEFADITKLSVAHGIDKPIFDGFNGVASTPVLEYPLQSCKTNSDVACWIENATGTEFTYKWPVDGSVIFILNDNRFECKTKTESKCEDLTL